MTIKHFTPEWLYSDLFSKKRQRKKDIVERTDLFELSFNSAYVFLSFVTRYIFTVFILKLIFMEIGGNVSISCHAKGYPRPTIIWRREGKFVLLVIIISFLNSFLHRIPYTITLLDWNKHIVSKQILYQYKWPIDPYKVYVDGLVWWWLLIQWQPHPNTLYQMLITILTQISNQFGSMTPSSRDIQVRNLFKWVSNLMCFPVQSIQSKTRQVKF